MKSEIQIRLEKLILSIKAHPDYVYGQDGDEWHDLVSLAEKSIEENKEIGLINIDSLSDDMKERIKFWQRQTEFQKIIIGYPIEYKLGMIVYHNDVYDGREPLKIVGIRHDELELRGDYSGMNNIIDNCWLPIEGVSIKKL